MARETGLDKIVSFIVLDSGSLLGVAGAADDLQADRALLGRAGKAGGYH